MALCTQGKEKERTLKSAIEALEKIEGELKRSENKYFGGESIGKRVRISWLVLVRGTCGSGPLVLSGLQDYGVWCGCCLHQLLRLVALGFCYGVILGCFVVGDGFESLVLGCALGDTVDLARCVRMCLSNIEIAVDLEGHVGADSSFGLGCLGESGSTSLLPCQ
ncbi:glutathione transferase, partial [Sarracenia purpurea var. burkii]